MTPTDQPSAPVRSVIEHPRAPAQRAPRQYGLFVPQLLMTLTLAGWLGFQAFQQVGEREQLQALSASGAAQEQTAQKLRASLEAIASATAKLANDGNANAQAVVDQLRKRGVTINAAAPAKSQ